jgi:hypothetical protein
LFAKKNLGPNTRIQLPLIYRILTDNEPLEDNLAKTRY